MSTRAQLVTLLNTEIKSGNSDTTAANLRTYENDFITSAVNKTDDLNVNGGYLGISSGRVDVTFINKATPSGQFLRDDGTWQTVSTATPSLQSVLGAGNVTGGTNIVISASDRIDTAAGGTLNIGTTDASIVNLGKSGGAVNIVGPFKAQLSAASLLADRIFTFPDVAGTFITTGNLTSITTTGALAAGSIATGFTSISTSFTDAKIKGAISNVAGYVPYGTGTADTVTSSANLIFTGTQLMIGGGTAGYTLDVNGVTRIRSAASVWMELSTTTTLNWEIYGSSGLLKFYDYSNSKEIVFSQGRISIGTQLTPTSWITIASEGAAAGLEPIRFTKPSAVTTVPVSQAFGPVAGGDNLYFVIDTGPARKNIVMDDGILLTSGRVPYVTTNGRLTNSANLAFTGTVLTSLNYYSTGTAPSIAAGTGAGTGPTVSVIGSNSGGQITVTTGTLPATGATIVTLTFSAGFTLPTGCYPVVCAGSSNAALAAIWYVTGTATTLVLSSATGLGLTAATTYLFNYCLIGY